MTKFKIVDNIHLKIGMMAISILIKNINQEVKLLLHCFMNPANKKVIQRIKIKVNQNLGKAGKRNIRARHQNLRVDQVVLINQKILGKQEKNLRKISQVARLGVSITVNLRGILIERPGTVIKLGKILETTEIPIEQVMTAMIEKGGIKLLDITMMREAEEKVDDTRAGEANHQVREEIVVAEKEEVNTI